MGLVERAGDVRDDVHDVAVALDDHEIIHLHAAVLRDAADVVACEIDQHQVLGTLLRVGQQLGGERIVLLRRLAPPARPGDRADVDAAIDGADMNFRRRADQREVTEFQDEHVGRRIHMSQRPVEIHRRAMKIRGEALARDELEHVARSDVFLPAEHHVLVFSLRGIAFRRLRLDWREAVESGYVERAIEHFYQGGDLGSSGAIGLLQRGMLASESIRENLQAAQALVEDNQRVGQHEDGVGNAEFVLRWRGHGRFELAHGVVGEIADQTAAERRQVPVQHEPVAAHVALQGGEHVVFNRDFLDGGAFADGEFLAAGLDHPARAAADDRPSSALVGAFSALEQEGMTRVAHLEVRRQRRLEVRRKLGVNRDNIALFGQLAEGFERRFDRNGIHNAREHGGRRPTRKPSAWFCDLTENQLSGKVPP